MVRRRPFAVLSTSGLAHYCGGLRSQRRRVSPGKARQWSPTSVRNSTSYPAYAPHPDGRRFAAFPVPETAPEEKGSAHVTFVLNFGDELRRRLPPAKQLPRPGDGLSGHQAPANRVWQGLWMDGRASGSLSEFAILADIPACRKLDFTSPVWRPVFGKPCNPSKQLSAISGKPPRASQYQRVEEHFEQGPSSRLHVRFRNCATLHTAKTRG